MDEFNDMRKMSEEHDKNMQKMAYDNMVKMGENFLATKGQKVVDDEIMAIRAYITAWNKISGSTMAYSLGTIDAFLAATNSVPATMGDMTMQMHPRLIHAVSALSAIRNQIIRERNKKIKESFPNLSTGDDGPVQGMV